MKTSPVEVREEERATAEQNTRAGATHTGKKKKAGKKAGRQKGGQEKHNVKRSATQSRQVREGGSGSGRCICLRIGTTEEGFRDEFYLQFDLLCLFWKKKRWETVRDKNAK